MLGYADSLNLPGTHGGPGERCTPQDGGNSEAEDQHRHPARDECERGAQPGQEGPFVGQREPVVRVPSGRTIGHPTSTVSAGLRHPLCP